MKPTVAILAALFGGMLSTPAKPLEDFSLTELEVRRDEIQAELTTLAHFSLRSGAGSNGYRSEPHPDAQHQEWVQVDLEREVSIDEIIMVPTLLRDSQTGFRAEGFPVNFRILAGTSPDETGQVVASFTEEDHLLPRIAPLVIPCNDTKASWIRIEADVLSARGIDDQYTFQLSELLVFSDSINQALRKKVRQPERTFSDHGPWGAEFLTDGSVPYLMDAAAGEKSIAFLSQVYKGHIPTLSIDLEHVYELSQINLHTIDQSDTIPQPQIVGYGIPQHFKIEGATEPDFSDAVLLQETSVMDLYSIAPILQWKFQPTPCRYVRLIALRPGTYTLKATENPRIGFAEIELLGNGINRALNKSVSCQHLKTFSARPLSKLTDGMNYFGRILPIQTWLNELAQRHALESERPRINAELNRRYRRQKRNLQVVSWLAVLLAGGIGFTMLIERYLRMRNETKLKTRFAADLHDELGANIHSIGLMSDLAVDTTTAEEWKPLAEHIRALTERTGTAIRHCTNMLESEELYIGLTEDMHRAAERIATNVQHDIRIDEEDAIRSLPALLSVDLFLFYKESLVNICRHSGADKLITRLTADEQRIQLLIEDNGCGTEHLPGSLKRRAKLMGGKLTLESPDSGGTRIILTAKCTRRTFRRPGKKLRQNDQ